MTLDDFNRFCGSFPGTETVRQWGDAHVWKVGGKVFALMTHWGEEEAPNPDGSPAHITFKCSDLAFEMLCGEEKISPAPYMGRYKWVQLVPGHLLTDEEVKAYLTASYDMVAKKLTRAKRKELGLV